MSVKPPSIGETFINAISSFITSGANFFTSLFDTILSGAPKVVGNLKDHKAERDPSSAQVQKEIKDVQSLRTLLHSQVATSGLNEQEATGLKERIDSHLGLVQNGDDLHLVGRDLSQKIHTATAERKLLDQNQNCRDQGLAMLSQAYEERKNTFLVYGPDADPKYEDIMRGLDTIKKKYEGPEALKNPHFQEQFSQEVKALYNEISRSCLRPSDEGPVVLQKDVIGEGGVFDEDLNKLNRTPNENIDPITPKGLDRLVKKPGQTTPVPKLVKIADNHYEVKFLQNNLKYENGKWIETKEKAYDLKFTDGIAALYEKGGSEPLRKWNELGHMENQLGLRNSMPSGFLMPLE